MRIGVTGGRNYADREMVQQMLRMFDRRDNVLVHGGARGADQLVAEVWTELGGKCERHDADWEGPCRGTCKPGHRRDNGRICPAAGVYRNQEMLDSGLNVLISFPGGAGTADMTRRCQQADIPILYAPIRLDMIPS